MLSKMYDVLAAVGLAAALAMVIVLDRHPGATTPTASAGELKVNVVTHSLPRERGPGGPKKLKLAVTPTHTDFIAATGEIAAWDDMGKLLKELGEGYRYDTIEPKQIAANPKVLDGYDVLFFTCAPGGEELKDALANFVARGGTLYASDFRFEAVAAAFPYVVDRNSIGSGTRQDVAAQVIDPALREIIGPTLPLHFDLSQWKVAAFGGRNVTPLVRGKFQKEQFLGDRKGVPAEGNFLVKFRHNKGTVIFTSFHNEKQNSELETKLLQHLVFQLVNANVDAEVTETNEQAGFEPVKSNLLSTPKDNPQITKTYQHAKAGPLRFSLGFRSEGAKLGLKLRSPDGREKEWEGESTVILEIPDAAAGEWRATVTALKLPYENFPFSVTFGAKK